MWYVLLAVGCLVLGALIGAVGIMYYIGRGMFKNF